MKKKRGLKILILSIFILMIGILLVNTVNSSENEINKAISCLEERLGDNCGNAKSIEQISFSLLAMAGNSKIRTECKNLLLNKEKEDCWAETENKNCKLKSTAQAILALNHIGININENIDWLLSFRKRAPGLNWFLEIDANNATECTITGKSENTFNIGEDKKITGTSSCLTPSEDGYFLKIKDSCYEVNFTISCDKDFITTLFYKKLGGNVYHISSQTHGAPAHGSTEESVSSYCFINTAGKCDYEGSLWATLALAKAGKNINPYLPYLTVNAEGNERYLPYAFLYMLTNHDEYYLKLIQQQKESKYWDESGKKVYDTALALLSLQNIDIDEVNSAKEYLFEIQDESGCWSNILNTALILFALNPPPAITSTGVSESGCEDFGHYCVSAAECSLENVLDNFYCPGLSEVCCRVKPLQETCEEKGGIECREDQECSGAEVLASDTNHCCLDSCIGIPRNECEDAGYICRNECFDNEEEKFGYECPSGVCCAEKEKAQNWWLIILLTILIALVILGIIFRNKLRLWLFKIKTKEKIKKLPPRPPARPLVTPKGMPPRPMPFPPKPPRVIPKKKQTEKDKEFEEVMRKLREMSK